MRRPVIGITAALEPVRFGPWHELAAFTPLAYVSAVQRAGGLAVLLVPDGAAPEAVLDVVDGLLVTGGADLDPATYGQDPHPETAAAFPGRDRFELALIRAATERDLPLLAVCRGMQVLNVARGGSLLQHLPEVVGHEEHRRTAGTFAGNDHEVVLSAGSLAARAAGEERHRTLSHHHQGIDRVGEGLVVTGRATRDDLVEAVEDPTRRWVLGVQWHPEADERSGVIAALVDEAHRVR
ncbi:MAG: gamma-glutamyl-gamma-aminobutyrate hydrolase family protein [Solirubrobacterales bacterium]|nr:gamma-glutamyl-gamma-aminobutyrate hydrolase family protein [Solirubrobacterales bacterium]